MKSGIVLMLLCFAVHCTYAQEICNNAIDDDGDGLVDLNDTLDCNCIIIPQIPPSLIPNYSFEDNSCCPSQISQLSCADNWLQASLATSDYYNLCDFTAIFTPPQTPLPGGGSGYVGFYISQNWNEQVGACLSGPLLAGTSYTLSFYTAWSAGSASNILGVFGTPNCGDLPWGTTTCPVGSGSWQALGTQSVNYTTDGAWQQVSISFTPSIDIYAISIGGTCAAANGVGDYYFIDELTLNTTNSYGSIGSDGHICTNDLVLYESFVNPGDSVQWYFNGIALIGETSDSLDGMTYGPGDYALINYLNGGGCEMARYTVDPPLYPSANFVSANGNCLGDVFVFINDTSTSPIQIEDWEWDMGDNTNISTYHAFHTFTSSGNFDVDLVVETIVGCTDTLTIPVTVNAIPDVMFEFTANGVLYQPGQDDTVIICGNDPINFNNLSTIQNPGLINQYNWDFGDLGTSVSTSPSHQYSNLGFYSVNLSAVSDAGCSDDFTCVIQVVDVPVADYTVVNGCQNLPFTFTNNSSIGVGSIINHSWTFGDQTSTTGTSPIHYYTFDGNYTTQLIVESDFGCIDSISVPLTVWPAPIADFQIMNHCIDETIAFTDQSSVSSGNILNWQWDFDDNNSSMQVNPDHDYSNTGNYNIELIVETDMGCRDTVVQNYIIYPLPEVNFEVENACENAIVNFDNNSSISSGSISQFNWDFDNNLTSGQENPPGFSYPDYGTYTISLELVSDQGCTSLASTQLEVFETPIADILGDPLAGCSPFDAAMFNFVDNNVYTCIWNFGDGNSVIDCGSVRNTYLPGVYDVSLVVYSENGCVDSTSESGFVTVNETPHADFVFSPQTVTISRNDVNFVNLSSGGSSYIWDFGDGSEESTEESPKHAFPDQHAATYAVSLTVYNGNNTCYDETTKTVVVEDEVIFYIPNTFTPGDDNLNSVFLPVFTSGIDIYDYKLTIFNRWGEVLFISYNPEAGWDGTYQSAEVVEQGIYIWQVEYGIENKDERQTEQGTVNLIK